MTLFYSRGEDCKKCCTVICGRAGSQHLSQVGVMLVHASLNSFNFYKPLATKW